MSIDKGTEVLLLVVVAVAVAVIVFALCWHLHLPHTHTHTPVADKSLRQHYETFALISAATELRICPRPVLAHICLYICTYVLVMGMHRRLSIAGACDAIARLQHQCHRKRFSSNNNNYAKCSEKKTATTKDCTTQSQTNKLFYNSGSFTKTLSMHSLKSIENIFLIFLP